jgi:phage-related protein
VEALSRPPLKPLKWVGGSKKSLDGVPEDVKDVFGSALLDVQYGETPDGVKPFGEGLPHQIWKIVEDYDGTPIGPFTRLRFQKSYMCLMSS